MSSRTPNNNSSGRNNDKDQTQLKDYLRNHAMYRPSIYQYRCYGAFETKLPPSVSDEKIPSSLLSSATTGTTSAGTATNQDGSSSQNENNPYSFPKGTCYGLQSKWVHLMDLDESYLRHLKLSPSSSSQSPSSSSSSWSPLPRTLVGTADRTTFSSLGTTVVNVLTVRPGPTKPDVVLGLECQTTFGVSNQESIQGNQGTKTSKFRIGPIQAVLEKRFEIHPEFAKNQHRPPQGLFSLPSNRRRDGEDTEKLTRPLIDESKKKILSETTIFHFGKAMYQSSKRILQSMKSNSMLCIDTLRDDFPRRWWKASCRIVNQFDTTANRTLEFAKDVYGFWTRDDDDDDDDDNDGMF
jgi:hypothetical protein